MGKQDLKHDTKVSKRVKKSKVPKKKSPTKKKITTPKRTRKIERLKFTITQEFFVVGNPMLGRTGSDTYSYRLNEIVDLNKGVIRANFYDFGVEGGDKRHVDPGSLYKLVDDDTFSRCCLSDKGNWVLTKKLQDRYYISLIRSPIQTYYDPCF